jgi:mono/diheme cytochrome c family protein
MIKRILKGVVVTFGVIIAVLLVTYIFMYIQVERRMNKVYDVAAEPITVRHDSAAIAHGERLVAVRACRECHGEDLGGRTLIDDFPVGRFVVKNLTRGKGGLRKDFEEQDWVLAMKHGLRRDGTPLRLMPSHELSHMSAEDMSDIIAYCSQLPNVDRQLPEFKIGPLGYILSALDQIPLLPAENTDHNLPFVNRVQAEVSATYGQYMAVMCVNCHGDKYKGGESPVPGGKYRPDITASGNPGKWTEQQFIHALRTGETPEGKKMNAEDMPWTITKNYNDTELKALRLFLKSLP